MKNWRSVAASLLAIAACGEAKTEAPAPPLADQTQSQPALWRISDEDTTVYLFGTVHVLPPELSWHSPVVDKALDKARAVYFETDTEGDPLAFRELVARLGKYGPSDQLIDHLSSRDRKRFEAALMKLNLPVATVNAMRPWYAGVVISEAVVRNAGYEASSGVENVLRPEARRQGKDIRFLESIEEQLSSFATLPENAQLHFLIEGLDNIDGATKGLRTLVDAWRSGDLPRLEKILIDDDMARIPELYDALLTKRNANWARDIATLMKREQGVFFVAIGAAHLLGKDSVIAMLKPLGYVAELVE